MIDLKRLAASFHFASEGIWHALKENQNLRIAFIEGLGVSILSLLFQITAVAAWIVIFMAFLLIISEMINTAFEEIVNLITNEHRKEAKIAKDVSAGMVLLMLIFSHAVWLLVFVPHVIDLFTNFR